MNAIEAEDEIVVPSIAGCFTHFMLGLNVGLAVYGFYLWFCVGGHLHGKPTDATWNAVFAGLTIPILLSAGAIGLAWWRPVVAAASFVAVAALFISATLLTGACLIVWTLIAFSGYC